MALPGEIELRRAAERCGVGRVGECARADDAIRMGRLLCVRLRLCLRVWVCGRQTGSLGRNAERAKQRVGRDGLQVDVVTVGGGGIWRAGRKKQVSDNIHTVQGGVNETGRRSVSVGGGDVMAGG
jgi:hypothetical protein